MTETRKSALHGGFEDYEVRRGTLVANVTSTVTFAAPVIEVEIRTIRTELDGVVVATLEGTEPTSDGSGDTENVMIEVPLGDSVALDKRTQTVKLRSAVGCRFLVTGVR